MATFGVKAIPDADGAGARLLRRGSAGSRVDTLAANAQFVREIDALQYDCLA